MFDFFHGRRRKTGCVLLVMALAFTCGWIRSRIAQDTFSIVVYDRTHFVVLSKGEIWWMQIENDNPPSCSWTRGGFTRMPNGRFVLRKGTALFTLAPTKAWAISYWQFATPLTLLSAYLLLWPGKRKAPSPHLPVSTAH